MATFYPRTEHLPGIEDMDLDAYLRRFKHDSAPLMWAGLLLGTALFHATPLITVFVPLPAFALPAGLRDRHASKLLSHPFYYLRQPVFLLKMVAGLHWGAHPDVRKHLGLEPYPQDPGTLRQS